MGDSLGAVDGEGSVVGVDFVEVGEETVDVVLHDRSVGGL